MLRNHFERKRNWERMINPAAKRQLPALPGMQVALLLLLVAREWASILSALAKIRKKSK